MKLEDILSNIKTCSVTGNLELDITGINIDSRLIDKGHLFIAVKERRQTDIPISEKPSRKALQPLFVRHCLTH